MPLRALLPLVLAALLAAGCGGQPSSAGEFEGEERAVAETVEDLQRAAERGETDRICRDFLSAELADRIAAGGESCQEEVEKAVADASAVELEVQEVEVSGSEATARVRGQAEPSDELRELALVRGGEPERWRVDSFGPPG